MPKENNEEVTSIELSEELKQVLKIYSQSKENGENSILLGQIKKGKPVIKAKSSDGIKYSTNESRNEYKKNVIRQEAGNTSKIYYNRSHETKFIWMIYQLYQEINKYTEILTSSDLTRLIYIATFVDWKGRLMETEKTLMTKEVLKSKLKLSRNKFAELFKKLIELNILIEYIDKKESQIIYYMNPEYFYKGEIDTKEETYKQKNFTRLFTKQVQYLYENTITRSHKTLSVLFRTIPYLNIKYNIVCKNPTEFSADLINPMSLKELGQILGYSEIGIKKLREDLGNIKTMNNKHVITFASPTSDLRTLKIIVNPKVIYGGKDYRVVEGIGTLF